MDITQKVLLLKKYIDMSLKIYPNSTNYTCQVVKLPAKIPVKGLDNLVEVKIQGNSCLISKDSPEDQLYLFFPAESKLSETFLAVNNLYRHSEKNTNTELTGFFEDTGRVKAIKFKGVISSGFVIPVSSLSFVDSSNLKLGDEFNEIAGQEICRKYVKQNMQGKAGTKQERQKTLDNIVDAKLAPEHMDTAQLLRNVGKLDATTRITVSYKLHGTSARTFNTLVKRKLNWKDKVAKFFGVKIQEEKYDTVACSRRTIKSVGLEALDGKQHYYKSGDLWTEVVEKHLDGKLNEGESIYYEIIGKTYSGEAIQGGYTYGFNEPKIYVYRMGNINPQGIEIDLTQEQMELRVRELGLEICPVFFKGDVNEFILKHGDPFYLGSLEEELEKIFYDKLLEQPSILDSSVVEEGFCVRIEGYPKPLILKVKSKKFLEHETKAKDKELVDLEELETQTESNDTEINY